jgi:pyridoxal phosphate-dependent aminotransferase EpsN
MRKRIYLSAPHMDGRELEYISRAYASNWLSTVGPDLEALEREFAALTGCHCLPVASGTAALHLAIKLLALREGDEVIAPTLTFVASVNPVLYERAVPVFIDSDYTSWNLDPHLLSDFLKKRAAVNRLPRAVIAVDLFGQTADLRAIRELCDRYELPLVEDAAEALGATCHGKPAGTWGDLGIYSFNGNKIITGSAGGMLVSERREWIEKARYWSNQSQSPGNDYLHAEIGYNYRLSNVLAAIIRGQLEVLPERIEQRRAIAFRYRDALGDIGFSLMPQAAWGLHTNWLSCFLIDEEKFGMTQSELIRHLEGFNIESRRVWKPMHTQKLFENFECAGGAVAEDLNRRGICLPSSSSLDPEDQQFVIDCIRSAHRRSMRTSAASNG